MSAGDKSHLIVIASYGNGKAIISADSMRAVSLYKTGYIIVKNSKVVGVGAENR